MAHWIRYAVFGSAFGCFAFALGGCYQAVAHSLLHDEAIRFGIRMPGWLCSGAIAGVLIGMVTWWSEILETRPDTRSCKSHEHLGRVHTPNLRDWSERLPNPPLVRSESQAARSLLRRRYS